MIRRFKSKGLAELWEKERSGKIDAKLQALACYRSQFTEGRPMTPPTILDNVRDRARYWGWAIGVGFGEPFLTREEVGLRNLRDLV